jgi:hypothetical protein
VLTDDELTALLGDAFESSTRGVAAPAGLLTAVRQDVRRQTRYRTADVATAGIAAAGVAAYALSGAPATSPAPHRVASAAAVGGPSTPATVPHHPIRSTAHPPARHVEKTIRIKLAGYWVRVPARLAERTGCHSGQGCGHIIRIDFRRDLPAEMRQASTSGPPVFVTGSGQTSDTAAVRLGDEFQAPLPSDRWLVLHLDVQGYVTDLVTLLQGSTDPHP